MKIKDIGRVVTGKTPSTKIKENFEGTIPFITPEDIFKGYIIKDTNRHISEKGYESILSNTLNDISVLVGCIGSDMGNVAITNCKCASNQQINAITDINKEWNPFYVYYNLSLKKKYFRQLAGMTTTPILPKSVFEEIDIPFVDIKLQTKIVNMLKAIDDKIVNNNKINKLLEDMTKDIYNYWFLQFEFPNKEGNSYKSSGEKMVWNEELNKEIPEGWNVQKLEKLCSLKNGINYDKNELGDKNYKIVNVRNITSTSFILNKQSFDNIKLNSKQSEKYLVENDDILIARSGSPGAVRLLLNKEDDIIFSGFIIACKPNDKKYKLYIAQHLKQFEGTAITKTGGSILQNVSQETLNSIKVVIPNNDEIINKFNDIVYPLLNYIQKNMNESEQLTSLRDFLLPLLMNGQVGFKDEEKY